MIIEKKEETEFCQIQVKDKNGKSSNTNCSIVGFDRYEAFIRIVDLFKALSELDENQEIRIIHRK